MENREPEVWKEVEGYEGQVQVSNFGRVRKVMYRELYVGRSGYLSCAISYKSRNYYLYVHQLVAQAFLEKKDTNMVVNHKDFNITNNNYENLEWVSMRSNVSHGIERRECFDNPYTGVHYRKQTGNFHVRITVNNKRYSLGEHYNAETGAFIYLSALKIIGEENIYFKNPDNLYDKNKKASIDVLIKKLQDKYPYLRLKNKKVDQVLNRFGNHLRKNNLITPIEK